MHSCHVTWHTVRCNVRCDFPLSMFSTPSKAPACHYCVCLYNTPCHSWAVYWRQFKKCLPAPPASPQHKMSNSTPVSDSPVGGSGLDLDLPNHHLDTDTNLYLIPPTSRTPNAGPFKRGFNLSPSCSTNHWNGQQLGPTHCQCQSLAWATAGPNSLPIHPVIYSDYKNLIT